MYPGGYASLAIIPLAGFSTWVFLVTKTVRKCFLLLDTDGALKPALMIMLDELLEAGIEEICVIIGEDEQEKFDRFFAPLSAEHRRKLPAYKTTCEEQISRMGQHITYVHQKKRLGFGHAVWLAMQFADNDPVLLLFGDFPYRSNTGVSCYRQLMDAYKECGRTLVAITEVPLECVVHYGIVNGVWEDALETMMKIDSMVEKPTYDYAQEYL